MRADKVQDVGCIGERTGRGGICTKNKVRKTGRKEEKECLAFSASKHSMCLIVD